MSETGSKVQVEFHVAKGEENFGPWTIEEIAERVGRSEISVTDFVFDDGRNDWIPLLECEAFKAHLQKSKPKAPPPKARQTSTEAPVHSASTSQVVESKQESVIHLVPPQAQSVQAMPLPKAGVVGAEWFVQKGANRYGPLSYNGLVRALQEKTVYDFDFIWKEGMSTWTRIAEHEDFHPERIRELAGKLNAGNSESSEVFFRRQHPRIRFESEVIVHDDRSVWMGQAFEASAGGSGVVIENSTLNPGQVIRIHFAPCDGLPAFNALGEIVGKRFSKEIRGSKSPVRYAVRFLKLDGSAEPQVREYFEAKAAS